MKPSVSRPGATPSGRLAAAARSKTIGRLRSCAARASSSATDAAVAADHVEVARHQRERLGSRRFAAAIARRVGIGRVAGQMIAAQALDRDDLARHVSGWRRARRRRARDRRARARRRSATSLALGPQPRTGDGLGVEATIARIIVFATASTQLERRHRGRRAIVGNRGDNAQSRPAMRAAREGIAIMAVVGGRPIRPCRPRRSQRRARSACEPCCSSSLRYEIRSSADPNDDRVSIESTRASRREVAFDTVEKGGQPRPIAADPQQNTVGIVEHFAGEPQLARDVPNLRSEANALHASPNPNFERLEQLRIVRTHCITSPDVWLCLPLSYSGSLLGTVELTGRFFA